MTHPVCGAGKFLARPTREEDRPELENLVIFGKGFRWCCARASKASDEECRKPETADLRDTSRKRLWRDFLMSRSEGGALEVVRGVEQEPGLEQ